MAMKVISSKEAQNSFGALLDNVQREPVVVTRRSRPVGVMFSMDNLPALFEFTDSMRETIKRGVEVGLEEAKVGKGEELNDEYVAKLKAEILAK
jgi:prevent-host-death family protein